MFIDMEPRSKAGKSSTGRIGTGRETLRLRSKGPATVEEVVCYVHLIPICLGNGWTFVFVRAGNKGPLPLCSLSSQSYPLETQMRWNNLFKALQWLPTSLGVKAKVRRVTNTI